MLKHKIRNKQAFTTTSNTEKAPPKLTTYQNVHAQTLSVKR